MIDAELRKGAVIMRRSHWLAATAAAALSSVLAPTVSWAQTAIRIGAEVNGRLETGDSVAPESDYADAHLYDEYRFTARAGQRLEIILRSDEFDPVLELYAEGAAEPLAVDDDGLGEGLNSRLRYTPEARGTYVLRARAFSGVEGGAYVLSVRERPRAPRAPRPVGVRLGDSLSGEITTRDAEHEEGGRYDDYLFRGAAGERVEVRLESEAFDPVLRIGRMVGGEFSELAWNDDWGGELNARLLFSLPEAGDYVIRAAPFSVDGLGAYTLSVQAPPPSPPAVALAVDETVEGVLAEDAAPGESGHRAAAYRFTGTADQRISISVSSSVFDTYLELFREEGGARVSVAVDDDGAGEGTNSRLLQTLAADGDYVIEVRSFADAGSGEFTLALEEAAPERAPESLAFGVTVQGEIGEEDPRDARNRGYDAYAFTGVEGRRVRIVMRSGDFDTYLSIGSADGEFVELAGDDDGLGQGTDSRLSFTLPSDGGYVVRAQPLTATGKGLYSLELTDLGPAPRPGSLLVGETARGTLSETDSTADDGSHYDAYRFQAKSGETLVITMVSNDFDAFLILGRESDTGRFSVLASDDDGLSDTHARLEWTAPGDGVYVIRAGSYAQREEGDYALRIERKP